MDDLVNSLPLRQTILRVGQPDEQLLVGGAPGDSVAWHAFAWHAFAWYARPAVPVDPADLRSTETHYRKRLPRDWRSRRLAAQNACLRGTWSTTAWLCAEVHHEHQQQATLMAAVVQRGRGREPRKAGRLLRQDSRALHDKTDPSLQLARLAVPGCLCPLRVGSDDEFPSSFPYQSGFGYLVRKKPVLGG